MGFKKRGVRASTRGVEREIQSLVQEVIGVISDENEVAGARLAGYLDELEGRVWTVDRVPDRLHDDYLRGQMAAKKRRRE